MADYNSAKTGAQVDDGTTFSLTSKNFSTAAEMITSTKLSIGDIVETKGHLLEHDGSGARYEIVAAATGTADDSNYVNLTGITGQARLLSSDSFNNTQNLTNFIGGTQRHILCGIDSLTDGAGGDSYVEFMRDTVAKYGGYGGLGFISFEAGAWSREGLTSGFGQSGFTYISTLTKTDSPAKYSLMFGGAHDATYTNANTLDFDIDEDWDTCRVYYLQQASGATFKVDHSTLASGDYRYTVDTSGAVGLAYVDITRDTAEGSGLSIKHSADGILSVFGAYFARSNGFPIVSRAASGSLKMSEAAAMDATAQAAWFTNLDPDVLVLNGGMNDRNTDSAATYIANVSTYLANKNSGCDVLLVGPNAAGDETTSNLEAYRLALRDLALASNYGFINVNHAIGGYDQAVDYGLMFDTVHPNTKGNRVIAAAIGSYLGFPSGSEAFTRPSYDVPALSYEYSGSLTEVHDDSVAASGTLVAYTLGLTNAYPSMLLEVIVTSQRAGTGAVVRTRWLLTVTNSTVVDAATEVSAVTEIEEFRTTAGDFSAHNHTITAAIVSNKAEITYTALVHEQIVHIQANWVFGNLTVQGTSVYEA